MGAIIKYWISKFEHLRPQHTRRTSWKLVANPGCQLVCICNWQFVANLVIFDMPLVQQVANQHVVTDLSGCPKMLRTSWQLVGNPGWQLVSN